MKQAYRSLQLLLVSGLLATGTLAATAMPAAAESVPDPNPICLAIVCVTVHTCYVNATIEIPPHVTYDCPVS